MARYVRLLALTMESHSPEAADAVAQDCATVLQRASMHAPIVSVSLGALGDEARDPALETPDVETLLETVFHAAHVHGADSDPDHEVGDLQDALRAAVTLLLPEQRGALWAGPGLINDAMLDLVSAPDAEPTASS